MSKETAKRYVGIFKWLYSISAILLLGLGIFTLLNTNASFITEVISKAKINLPSNINHGTVLGVFLIGYAAVNLIEALLFKRAADDGRKTTLLIILLIISVVSAICNVVATFNVSSLCNLFVNVLTLYAVIVLRKNA